MSGNATTRSTDRERFRARPVASLQPLVASPTSELQPPVLFRFPAIAAPLAVDHGPPNPVPAAFGDEVEARLPTESQTELGHSGFSPQMEAMAPDRVPDQVVQTEGTAKSVSVDAEEAQFSALATAPQLANGSISAVAPMSAPQSSAATSAASARTWWEHWSSGVVLILLIIALVTASIIALNDGSPSRNQPLASELETAAVDEFDLSSISIPDITLGSLGTLDYSNTTVTTTAGTTTAGTTTVVTVTQPPAESVADSTNVAGTQQLAQPQLGQPQLADAMGGPVAGLTSSGAVSGVELLPGSLELSSAELQAATAASIPGNAAGPLASQLVQTPQATLAPPVGIAPPQLFADAPTRGDQQVSSSLATTPASGPTASLAMPLSTGGSSDSPDNSTAAGNALIPATVSPNAGIPSTPGASPTFYDGAAQGGELHASTVYNAEGMADTNLPSFPAMLASSSTEIPAIPATGVNPSSGLVFTTASHTQPGVEPVAATTTDKRPEASYRASSAATNGNSGGIPSATPESDSDAMIKAYLKFQELNRAATGGASNRYGADGTSRAGSTGAGFTLGNPQTVTGPATAPAR